MLSPTGMRDNHRAKLQHSVANPLESARPDFWFRWFMPETTRPPGDDQTTQVVSRDAPTPTNGDQLTPGDTLKDRFVIESVIGRGGMGIV